MPTARLHTREAAILRQRVAGESFAAIAREHGISTTRVRQILRRLAREAEDVGKSAEELAARKAEERAALRRERETNIAAWREHAAAAQAARFWSDLAEEVGVLAPDWRALNTFANALNERHTRVRMYLWYGAGRSRDGFETRVLADPRWEPLAAILTAWSAGGANDHATVNRLRRLLVDGVTPQGIAA